MTNEQMQEKFKSLSNMLNNLKLEKAKAEANLETLTNQKSSALDSLQVIANVNTVEEAEEALVTIKQELMSLAEQAEAILHANE
jgi:hypothetical protein